MRLFNMSSRVIFRYYFCTVCCSFIYVVAFDLVSEHMALINVSGVVWFCCARRLCALNVRDGCTSIDLCTIC